MKRCYLCGYDINGNIKDPRNPAVKTMDHVRPKALGGKRAGNVRPAHRICNLTKGARFPTLDVVAECKKAFESTKAFKKERRKMSRQVATRADHFCIGESR